MEHHTHFYDEKKDILHLHDGNDIRNNDKKPAGIQLHNHILISLCPISFPTFSLSLFFPVSCLTALLFLLKKLLSDYLTTWTGPVLLLLSLSLLFSKNRSPKHRHHFSFIFSSPFCTWNLFLLPFPLSDTL